MRMRSALFVPGDRPDRVEKAFQAGADAVILDLEDAVLPDSKQQARRNAGEAVNHGNLLLRVNAYGTPWFEQDLQMAAVAGYAGIVIPKADSDTVLHAVRKVVGPNVALYPLVETVMGVANLRALAAFPGVARLIFGTVDFSLDSGIQNESAWTGIRVDMVIASRLADIQPPIDGTVLSWDDPDEVRRHAEYSRSLGFAGRLCIHPKQVAPVNQGMMPTEKELVWARKVMQATSDSAHGAIVVDGKLVDEPLRKIAERWLAAT